MPEQKQDNENISSTAWTIAHRRTFTDIPYSKSIFDEIERLRHLQGTEIAEELKSPEIAPQIEARYKLVSRLLAQNHIEQVLELAAGFSPRGLELTDDNSVSYVEIDLPDIAAQKREIVNTFRSRENLHLEEGNALDVATLQIATRYFDRSKPVGIIHEGLLRYLAFDQKAIVAKNIHALFGEFGGVWITPDITLKAVLKAENAVIQHQTAKVGQLIGVNIDQNSFENVDQAQKFFEALGFSVERHKFTEVIDELSSPSVLGQTRQEVEVLIGDAYVFVMRRKDK